MNALGDATFTATLASGGSCSLTANVDGTDAVTVGSTTLTFSDNTLQSLSETSGDLNFGVAPTTSGYSEGIGWDPTTDDAWLETTAPDDQIYQTPIDPINSGDQLVDEDGGATIDLYNSSDDELLELIQNNSDDTSTITNYGSDGSTATQNYSGPNGSGTPGKSVLMLDFSTVDQKTGKPVTYSAGVSFGTTSFTLPSVRLDDPQANFETTAHFVSGNLDPYDDNNVDISNPDPANGDAVVLSQPIRAQLSNLRRRKIQIRARI